MRAQLKGADTVLRELRKFGDKGNKAATRSVQRTMVDIQRGSRQAAPVNDGRLRASIGWAFENRDRTSGTVGPDVDYAIFVEFGTGPAGEQSNLSRLANEAMQELGYEHGPVGPWIPTEILERWAHKHGIPLEAVPAIQVTIRQGGIAAQPFLFPATEDASREFLNVARVEFEKAIRDG